jgi:hypothetical protein
MFEMKGFQSALDRVYDDSFLVSGENPLGRRHRDYEAPTREFFYAKVRKKIFLDEIEEIKRILNVTTIDSLSIFECSLGVGLIGHVVFANSTIILLHDFSFCQEGDSLNLQSVRFTDLSCLLSVSRNGNEVIAIANAGKFSFRFFTDEVAERVNILFLLRLGEAA